MSALVVITRGWLLCPTGSSKTRAYVLLCLAAIGPLGMALSLYYLVGGGVRGGRPVALALLGWTAIATALLVRIWRSNARHWHLLLALPVIAPFRLVDGWLSNQAHPWRLFAPAVLVAVALAYSFTRCAWTTLRTMPRDAQTPATATTS